MANIGFLRGTQANLDNLINNKTGADGVFYLTTDTNRLYIGKDGGSIVPVNAGIITVDKLENLPKDESKKIPGHYYYVTEGNILCVYNGTEWVQINSIVSVTEVNNTITANNNLAFITTTVNQDNNTSKTGAYYLEASDDIILQHSTQQNDDVTYDKITLKGSPLHTNLVATEDADKNITSVEMRLKNDDTNTNNLIVKPGTDITLAVSNGRELTIGSTASKYKNESLTVSNVDNSGDGFYITVKDIDGTNVTGHLNPTIAYGLNPALTETTFKDGVATLNVYTTSEVDGIIEGVNTLVDEKFETFNAMHYRGILPTEPTEDEYDMPVKNVQNGDVYLLGADKIYDSITYPAGSLVVAQGREEDDGFISKENISWAFITGSNVDTRYSFKPIANLGFSVTDSLTNDLLDLTVETDDGLVATTSGGNGQKTTVILDHKNYNTTTEYSFSNAGLNLDYISGITLDKGHITKIDKAQFALTLTGSNSTIAVSENIDADIKEASIESTVTLADGTNKDSIATLKTNIITPITSNIQFSNESNSLKVELVWGSFDTQQQQ